MGRRRHDAQGRTREELVSLGGGSAPTIAGPTGANVRDHLLSLQRAYGNDAVTTVVQRRDRPQSTDAPGYKAPKEKPKKGKKGPTDEEKYLPTPDPTLASLGVSDLTKEAKTAWDHASDPALKNDKNGRGVWLNKASRLYEQAWLKEASKPGRGIAVQLKRVYEDAGDTARAAFWSKVSSGEIDPKAPKPEPGSDRHA